MNLYLTRIAAFSIVSACVISAGFALAQNPPAAGMEAGAAAGMGAATVADKPTNNLSEVKSGNYVAEHDHTRIVWSIAHHGYSTFSAMFSVVDATLKFDAADITRSQLTAAVDMKSVGTLIPAFDKTLNGADYFNTEKYPTAVFTSTKILRSGANELNVTGDLTFLGITKPATMVVNFVQAGTPARPRGGYRVGFNGRMTINRTEWGMAKSTLGDDVSMLLEAEFLLPAPAAATP
jgi:polyisoprenoid-binding protein YceI